MGACRLLPVATHFLLVMSVQQFLGFPYPKFISHDGLATASSLYGDSLRLPGSGVEFDSRAIHEELNKILKEFPMEDFNVVNISAKGLYESDAPKRERLFMLDATERNAFSLKSWKMYKNEAEKRLSDLSDLVRVQQALVRVQQAYHKVDQWRSKAQKMCAQIMEEVSKNRKSIEEKSNGRIAPMSFERQLLTVYVRFLNVELIFLWMYFRRMCDRYEVLDPEKCKILYVNDY